MTMRVCTLVHYATTTMATPALSHNTRMLLAVILLSLCASEQPSPLQSQSALPPRPRMILTDARLAAVSQFIANSSQAASWFDALQRQGDWILSVPPKSVPGQGNTDQLGAARETLQRIYATGLLWRLTRNVTWAERCLEEAARAVQWPDWCVQKDSLVTAEMQHAVAIALDWLDAYFPLAPGGAASRAALMQGILLLGQTVMLEGYTSSPPPSWANENTFLNATNCYGIVVNSGAMLGALGLLGEPGVPSWVEGTVLPSALLQLQVAMHSFAPFGDGSWYEVRLPATLCPLNRVSETFLFLHSVDILLFRLLTRHDDQHSPLKSPLPRISFQGPNYGLYNSRLLAPLLFSLDSALGTDFGLSTFPGLESTPDAFVYSLAPDFSGFNWGDTDEVLETSIANLPFALMYGSPGTAYVIRSMVDAVPVPPSTTENTAMQAPVGLLYYSDAGDVGDRDALPKDRFFPGRDIVVFRSGWGPDATFFGAKGGTNGGPNKGELWAPGSVHLHDDGGSWVLHFGGARVVEDMGRDSYALPCYFCTPNRYAFYRIGALGHNTITLNGQTHDYPSRSRVISFNTTRDADPGAADAWAVLDLSPHFASFGVTVTRGFALFSNRSALLVVDEIVFTAEGGAPAAGPVVNLTWAAHVNASSVTQKNATALSIMQVADGRQTVATLSLIAAATSCDGGVLSAVPISLEPPQLPSTGFVRMQLLSTAPRQCSRIEVTVGAGEGGTPLPVPAAALRPLSEWGASGPFSSSS